MSLTISFDPAEAYTNADADGYYNITINATTEGDNVPVTLRVDEQGVEKTYTSATNELGVATFQVSGSLPEGADSYRYTITITTASGEEEKSSYTVLGEG